MTPFLQQSHNRQGFQTEISSNFSSLSSLFPVPSLLNSTPHLPKCLILKGLLKSLKNLKLQLQSTPRLLEDGKQSHLCRNKWKMNSNHDQILIKCKSPGRKSQSHSFLLAGYLPHTRGLLRVHWHNLGAFPVLSDFCSIKIY